MMLVVGYGLIIVDAVAQIISPVVFGVVLNRVQSDPDGFVAGGWKGPAMAAAVVAVTFISAAYISHTWTRRGAARWSNNLRQQLYEHVQRQSMDFFHRSQVGDIAGRINQDIERLEVAVWQGLVTTWAIVVLLLGVGLMVWIDVWLAAVATALLGLAALWTIALMPRLRRRSREVRDELGSTSGTLTELIGVNVLIKAFNAEAHAADEVIDVSGRVLDRTERMARLQHRYSDVLGLHLAFVAPFVLLFAGAWRVAQGSLLIGSVVAIWALWQRAASGLTNVANSLPELLGGLAAGERAMEILAEAPTVLDRPSAPALVVSGAALRFDHISFAYPGRPDHVVLDDFDLTVEHGHRVALVGPTGAGKSTVAQLLLRFYDPLAGRVTIDGQDLRELQQGSVREAIGVVFQDTVLISGSLARNLRLARPDATDDDLRSALEAASAWEFVEKWEDGLDTNVGERGVMLSGGQRQRLAIARVMLKDPAIVVLDEATSALDAENERLVLQALDRLLAGRTSLVVAHRIATIRDADQIVVVDRGRVADQGDHESLLRSSPTYRSYCRQQAVA
jgi:ATP-binding cassette, subfamily B, bacterial